MDLQLFATTKIAGRKRLTSDDVECQRRSKKGRIDGRERMKRHNESGETLNGATHGTAMLERPIPYPLASSQTLSAFVSPEPTIDSAQGDVEMDEPETDTSERSDTQDMSKNTSAKAMALEAISKGSIALGRAEGVVRDRMVEDARYIQEHDAVKLGMIAEELKQAGEQLAEAAKKALEGQR